MRVKLSKLLSAVLAICVVFAGFTAFAADATVVTTTNYNYNTHNDGNDSDPIEDAATMTITTDVTNVTAGTEITYLVRKADGTIVYINQETATASGAHFEFTADQAAIFAATAKYGSDGSYGMPEFSFNHGVNYLSNGTPSISGFTSQEYNDIADAQGMLFLGTVRGEVEEYGVTIDNVKYPAMGCDAEGNFAVLISGIDTTGAAAYAE